MDRSSVYTTRTFEASYDDNKDSRTEIQIQLETFILKFRLDNDYVYR